MGACASVDGRSRIRSLAHTHTHTFRLTCAHIHMTTHTCTHLHARVFICIYVYAHGCTHAYYCAKTPGRAWASIQGQSKL